MTMRLVTIEDLTKKTQEILEDTEPILITVEGQPKAIVLPISKKWRNKLLLQYGKAIRRGLQERGITEEEILTEFEKFRETSYRR